MIHVFCPTQHNYIIEVLEKEEDGIKYKFNKKTGINLSFEVDTDDLETAVIEAKRKIKASKYGAALYFQVRI